MKHRFELAVAGALAGLWLAVPVTAEPAAGQLAAPGPCAEPRVDLRTAPLPGFDADAAPRTDLRREPLSGFDVSGGPRAHFDPTDVASRSGGTPFSPPEPPGFSRTACDAPAAVCAGLGTGGLIESPPVPGVIGGVDPR